MSERPEQAIKWLTDKGVLHNTRKELLDYITQLEAERDELLVKNTILRGSIVDLEADSKRLDKLERVIVQAEGYSRISNIEWQCRIWWTLLVNEGSTGPPSLRDAIDTLEIY
jgi:hypothetical protein